MSITHVRNMPNVKTPIRGRPELYPHKKVIGFDDPMLAAIDNWRRKQKPIPNLSDAIRELIKRGLKKGHR